MIVYDKEQKQIVIPNGLGNVNIIINGGGDCPECPEQPGCNLGIGEFGVSASANGTYELNASDDGYDGWSKMFINVNGGAIKVWRAADLLNEFNTNIDILEFGTYYYVGGKITDITYVNTQNGDAKYTLDNGFLVDKGKWINGDGFTDENQIKVGSYIIVYGVLKNYNGQIELDIDSQVIAYQECEGGSCNLGAGVKEISENGTYNYSASEDGFDGWSNIEVRVNVPQSGEGGGGGSCNLISRTFTSNGVYHPEAEQMQTIWFMADKPSAYDTGIKLVNDSWVEIYFSATAGGDTPTLIGCEEGDWNNTVFATRWYDNNLGVKIGRNEIGIPYTANDGRLHKLKFGKTVGVWFDDVKVQDIAGEEWVPTDRTIYIGAMNDPSNNNEKGFWRYWVGFIGDVTVYGSLNENVGEYHFKAGDYGKWGEFKRVEDNTNLPNLGGDGMAIAQIGSYGEAPDGFSEVTVNVPQHNLGVLDWTLTSPYTEVKNASDDGYGGYSQVIVRPENVIAQEKENAINDFKNKMKEITITQNGTYSIDDQETRQYVEFDGNSYFDTGIVPTENAKIEVAITKTTYEEDEQFIGCAHYDLINEASTYGGFGLVAGAGLTYGCFGKAKTSNLGFSMEEEQILTLDRTGLESSLYGRVGWIDDSADFNYVPGRTIAIGKINSSDGWVYRGLNGRIRYVKIWTNKDDDSTMTLFRPKNMTQGAFGVVNSEGIETGHIENLGSGTATFVDELVKKYPNGFKRVEVNVVPQVSIKEVGLNVWYNDLKRITDENEQINSDWDLSLKGETIQSVFPGIAMTISGQAVAKPFFIDAVNGNSTATRIGKLVSSANGTPVSCAVVIIGAFDCKNIQNVDIEAFKYMTDLCFIDGMNGLGESFISPQTINFTYCTNLFIKSNSRKFISNFAESLFNLSAGNKNGINTSTLRFKSAVQERSENADAIALMRSKGWTVEFVSSDL